MRRVDAELLTRAGVGRLRIVDRDFVELSNLQRQLLHTDADVGRGTRIGELHGGAAGAGAICCSASSIDPDDVVSATTRTPSGAVVDDVRCAGTKLFAHAEHTWASSGFSVLQNGQKRIAARLLSLSP